MVYSLRALFDSGEVNDAMEEKTFRIALSEVIRDTLLLFVLTILREVAWKLPALDTMILGLNLGGYLHLGLTLGIIFVLVRLFRPLRAVIGHYLAVFAKVGRVPGREQYLAHLVPLSGAIVGFIYVIALYRYLSTVVLVLEVAFFHTNWLYKTFSIAAVAAGALCLYLMWRHVTPLIHLFTGAITEKTADATARMVTTKCSACGAVCDKELKFCPSCGGSLAAPAYVAPVVAAIPPTPAPRVCAQCAGVLTFDAKFCGACGTAA